MLRNRTRRTRRPLWESSRLASRRTRRPSLLESTKRRRTRMDEVYSLPREFDYPEVDSALDVLSDITEYLTAFTYYTSSLSKKDILKIKTPKDLDAVISETDNILNYVLNTDLKLDKLKDLIYNFNLAYSMLDYPDNYEDEDEDEFDEVQNAFGDATYELSKAQSLLEQVEQLFDVIKDIKRIGPDVLETRTWYTKDLAYVDKLFDALDIRYLEVDADSYYDLKVGAFLGGIVTDKINKFLDAAKATIFKVRP